MQSNHIILTLISEFWKSSGINRLKILVGSTTNVDKLFSTTLSCLQEHIPAIMPQKQYQKGSETTSCFMIENQNWFSFFLLLFLRLRGICRTPYTPQRLALAEVSWKTSHGPQQQCDPGDHITAFSAP